MYALPSPPIAIEFHESRARFQGLAHEGRVQQVQRQADALAEKAVLDRDRLKVRARL